MGKCAIKVAGAKDLSEFELGELEKLEEQIQDLMTYYVGDRGSMRKEFQGILDDFKADSRTRAVQGVANIIKERRLLEELIVSSSFKDASDGLLNLYEGNNSIETHYRTNSNHYSKVLYSRLHDRGVSKRFSKGELDEAIHIEAYNRANNKESVSDPDAVAAYEAIKDTNNVIYEDMRLAGMDVRYRRDFLVSQNHNAEKMLNVVDGNPAKSKEVWINYILDNIDKSETFTNATLPKLDGNGKVVHEGTEKAVLGKMYDGIIDGQRATSVDDTGSKNYLNSFKSRKLIFKDGTASYNYSQKFGNGQSLAESMQYQIDRSAKTVANVSILGTRAGITHQNLKQAYTKKFQGTSTRGKIERNLSKIEKAYKEVVAPPHAPATLLEKGVNFMRGLSAFSKLGSSIFSALWDVNSSAAMYYVRTGESQIKGYVDAIFSSTELLANPTKMRELGEALNVNIWFNDMAIAMGGHKGDYDSGYNWVNKVFNEASKWTGVPYQTKISRVVNGILQAKSFQKMIDNVDNLNNLQKLALDEYKIKPDDLKLIGKHANKHDSLGAITPSSILEMPLSVFGGNAGSATKKRSELHRKMSNYIDDAVQKGTPTPTAKAKRHLFKSRSENELRIIATLTMQFKETAWQILLSNKENLMKTYQANGVSGATRFVGEYAMLGFVSYMGIEYIKAKAFNKDDPFERFARGGDSAKEMFLDYMNKASFAPVLSDAATAAMSKYPSSNLTSYVAGPSMGSLSELGKVAGAKDSIKAGRKWVSRNAFPSTHIGLKALERNFLEYNWRTGERIRK